MMLLLATAWAWELQTLDVDGVERTVFVHVPDGAKRPGKRPALVAFHGAGPDTSAKKGKKLARQTQLGLAASSYGAVMAFPNGIDGRWHPKGDKVDDLAFADAVYDLLVSDYGVDPNRVAAAGFSSGGHQAMQWACHSARVSSIAVVAAGLSERQAKSCALAGALPSLFIYGRTDPINPIGGGEVTGSRGGKGLPVLSARKSAAWFARANGCTSGKEGILWAPNGTKAADRVRWKGCGRGKVELLVSDLGHVWPMAGTPRASQGASRVVARFFRKRAWRRPVRKR